MRIDLINTESSQGSTCALHPTIAPVTSTLFGRLLNCSFLLLLVSSCASYGVVENVALSDQSSTQEYSIKAFAEDRKDNELLLSLSFSGGGTCAAAFASSCSMSPLSFTEKSDCTSRISHFSYHGKRCGRIKVVSVSMKAPKRDKQTNQNSEFQFVYAIQKNRKRAENNR